ncbi:MAG: hypothetical protein KGQ83_01555 [Planctomycetes bacterium]|nr:hypothetical protein [Planctomycetota bacterium]
METSNSFSISFPSLFVPDADKQTELYHKQFVQAITNRSILSGYTDRYALMNECVNFYLGLQSGDEYQFLQTAEDGEVLPAKWADYNKIAVKVDLLIGELIQRNYKIDVKAYNKEAQSRKMDKRNELLINMRFQPIADILEQMHGLPLQSDEGFTPSSENELDVYMNKTYKDRAEIVMRAMLKWLRKYDNWDYERMSCFRDLLIMGAAFMRHEVIDGVPKMTRVDPRAMIFDSHCIDDFLSDSTIWGEIVYMPLKDVTKRYNITEEELKSAYNAYQAFLTNQQSFATTSVDANDFGFIDRSSRLRIFKQEAGELRVLVVKGFWQDFKTLSHKYSEDKYNGIHVKKMSNGANGDNVKQNLIQIWRTGTLIGGKFMRDWGEMDNQGRDIDPNMMAKSDPPYTACIPNFMNGAIISKVQRLRPMQNLKNIAMYQLQVMMARAKGKGFVYDVSQLPKGWDVHTAMKYLSIAGIAFINSAVEGAGQYNQFKEIDMTLSGAVEQYINISMLMDREMDAISGVNEARQGLIQSSSQAVGVTNSALLQSSLSTAMYYDIFSKFFTRSINRQAKLGKIAWAGKERFAPILGDAGIDFLKEDIELDLNDYNVFIEEVPPVIADQQLFYQMVMTALQQNSISFPSALKLLMEKDVDEGMQDLELEFNREKAQAQEQQQNQMDQQSQLMQQAQSKQELDRQALQVDAQLKQMKEHSGLEKVLMQGKLDLKQSLIGFKEQLALKRIELEIAKQKNKEKFEKRPLK